MTRFIQWMLVAVAAVAGIVSLMGFAFCVMDVVAGAVNVRTGLMFVIAILFLIVLAQASLHVVGAPLREQMVKETGETVTVIANELLPKSPESSSSPSTVAGKAATTVSRWVLFFASRGAVSGFLGIVATTLIGVLTVYVAFMQVKLLQNQTEAMTIENNARTLEYHLSALVEDIRRSNPVDAARTGLSAPSEEMLRQYVSPEIIGQRVNVLSRTLDTVPIEKGERTLELSRERGVLLSILIAEGFKFGAAPPLYFQSSDLSTVPPANGENVVHLGRLDLRNSYAATAELMNYNLARADLRGAILPPAVNLEEAWLRDPYFQARGARGDEQVMAAELEGAEVPTAAWLRELETAAGPRRFTATAWRVQQKSDGFFVVAHPNASVRVAETSLSSHASQTMFQCGMDPVKCKAMTREFCDQYASLAATPGLDAVERGSLFGLGVSINAFSKEVVEERAGPTHLIADASKEALVVMHRCIVESTFKGESKVDITHLPLGHVDFSGIDLRDVDFAGISLDDFNFAGASLPSAERFASTYAISFPLAERVKWTPELVAQEVVKRFDGAIVDSLDWESQICMSTFAGTPDSRPRASREFQFPFEDLKIVKEGEKMVLRGDRCGSTHFRRIESMSYEQRLAFCNECAAPPNAPQPSAAGKKQP